MEHIIKSSEDVGEVVFGQPEEKAGATGPDGSVLNRRKEDEWLEDTESYHGARPRTIEVFFFFLFFFFYSKQTIYMVQQHT